MIDILTMILITAVFIPLFVALLLILITKLLRKINKKETKLSKWSIAKHIFLSYVLCLSAITLIVNYADYSPRMAVNEGFDIAYSIQPKIEEYYEMHGSFPSSNYDVGISSPSLLQGNNVESVTISEGGVITILYKEQKRGKKYGVGGHTIIIKPNLSDGDIIWRCKSETMPFRLHPCYREFQEIEKSTQEAKEQEQAQKYDKEKEQINEFISSTTELKWKLFKHRMNAINDPTNDRGWKTQLSEYANDYNHNLVSEYVEPIIIYVPNNSDNIVIQAKFRSDTGVSEFIRGKTLSLSYVRGKSDSGHWQCGINSIGVTDIEKKYLPDSCR